MYKIHNTTESATGEMLLFPATSLVASDIQLSNTETANSTFLAIHRYFFMALKYYRMQRLWSLASLCWQEELVQGREHYIQPFSGKAHCALGHFTSVGGSSTFFAAFTGINTNAGSFTPADTHVKLHKERFERALRMKEVAFVSPS